MKLFQPSNQLNRRSWVTHSSYHQFRPTKALPRSRSIHSTTHKYRCIESNGRVEQPWKSSILPLFRRIISGTAKRMKGWTFSTGPEFLPGLNLPKKRCTIHTITSHSSLKCAGNTWRWRRPGRVLWVRRTDPQTSSRRDFKNRNKYEGKNEKRLMGTVCGPSWTERSCCCALGLGWKRRVVGGNGAGRCGEIVFADTQHRSPTEPRAAAQRNVYLYRPSHPTIQPANNFSRYRRSWQAWKGNTTTEEINVQRNESNRLPGLRFLVWSARTAERNPSFASVS